MPCSSKSHCMIRLHRNGPIHLGAFPLMLTLLFVLLAVSIASANVSIPTDNLLKNPTFLGADLQMLPEGWVVYGSFANGHRISVVDNDNPARRALLLEDLVDIPRGNEGEIGIQQTVPGGPGHYRVTARVGAVAGAPADVVALQLRFLPSNELTQVRLTPTDTVGFEEFIVDGTAPAGTTHVRVYLYTFAAGQPKVRVHSVTLEAVSAADIDDRIRGGVIKGIEPLTFDLSQASVPSPPLSELRSRIPEGRPRLFVTPDTLDDIRNKRRTAPIAGLVWTNLSTLALTYKYAPMPQYPPDAKPGGVLDITAWRRGIEIANDIGARLDTLGFFYLMTGDIEAGEAAKKLLLHVAEWDPYGNSGRAKNDEISMRLLYTMSRAYDWIQPLLTDDERTLVQETMRERGNDVYITMRNGRFEEKMLDNHLVRSLGFLGQAAIAFMGELPEADVWFDYVVGLLLTKYPPFGGDEGGWSQGVSYWQSYISWLFEFMDALRTATGLDLYQMPFFRNTGYFKLYAHPPESQFGAFGDHSDSKPDAGSARVISKLAMEYMDPALQWYVHRINRMGRVPDIPMNTFIGYLWAPSLADMPPTPALPPDFPQSRVFHDVGWVLMNVDMSDWENNVHVKFKSSPYGSFNHSHAEQNSFQIEAYGSPLAIPSGYYPWYGSPHHATWTWQTRSKNSILVNGQGQRAQSIDAKGHIVTTSFGPQFDYTVGDATQAYMGNVERFLRHMMFIKPNLIVIYDQLERRGMATTYDWLLHSVGPMQVEDDALRVRVDGKTAHMWVNFVTPTELDFHVTDQFPIAPEERDANKPNQWHLTAKAKTTDGVGRFLTVLVPRPKARSNEAPPEVSSVPAQNGHATQVTMDGHTYIVAFQDDAQAPLTAHGASTDAAVLVMWTSDPDGNESGIMGVAASYVEREGEFILRSAEPITVGAHWEPTGDAGEMTLNVQLDGDTPWLEFAADVSVASVMVNGTSVSWTQVEGVLRIEF